MDAVKLKNRKVEASRRIYAALEGACVIVVKYLHDGALAYAVFRDGVKEYMFVPYEGASGCDPETGQHEWAMRCIGSEAGMEEGDMV